MASSSSPSSASASLSKLRAALASASASVAKIEAAESEFPGLLDYGALESLEWLASTVAAVATSLSEVAELTE